VADSGASNTLEFMGIIGGASKRNANGMQIFYRVKVEERPSYSYLY
jgi:hypothetical protein